MWQSHRAVAAATNAASVVAPGLWGGLGFHSRPPESHPPDVGASTRGAHMPPPPLTIHTSSTGALASGSSMSSHSGDGSPSPTGSDTSSSFVASVIPGLPSYPHPDPGGGGMTSAVGGATPALGEGGVVSHRQLQRTASAFGQSQMLQARGVTSSASSTSLSGGVTSYGVIVPPLPLANLHATGDAATAAVAAPLHPPLTLHTHAGWGSSRRSTDV